MSTLCRCRYILERVLQHRYDVKINVTFLVVTRFPFLIVVDVDDDVKCGPPIEELELIELKFS